MTMLTRSYLWVVANQNDVLSFFLVSWATNCTNVQLDHFSFLRSLKGRKISLISANLTDGKEKSLLSLSPVIRAGLPTRPISRRMSDILLALRLSVPSELLSVRKMAKIRGSYVHKYISRGWFLASIPGPHRHRISDRREEGLVKLPFCFASFTVGKIST